MKSSMRFSGKVIKLLPDDFPYTGQGAEQMTYDAVIQLLELNELAITPNIKKITGLGKSSTQSHLNNMEEKGTLVKNIAKVQLENTTVVCGVYTLPKLASTKKNTNRKTKNYK